MARSRYDDLHDRYHKILTTKAGTRYERLAALVFKILADRNIVIHDLKLIGDSTVSHQIDISISVNGRPRRVIVECKDFDLSGDKVGLDIVRNFRSVIEDTKADEGVVLTCTGYTKDARIYAKAKGIKLAVLREIKDDDLEGLIRTVNIDLKIQSNKNHSTTVKMSEQAKDLFNSELARFEISGAIHSFQPVFFVRDSKRIGFTDFLSNEVNERAPSRMERGQLQIETPSAGWFLQVADGPMIPFDCIVTTYENCVHSIPISITADRIAELIVSGIGDNDIIIFGDQIQGKKVDAVTGEIL